MSGMRCTSAPAALRSSGALQLPGGAPLAASTTRKQLRMHGLNNAQAAAHAWWQHRQGGGTPPTHPCKAAPAGGGQDHTPTA